MSDPILHLIAGPNGAGKSTFCVDYVPAVGDPPLLNADVLAAGLSPNNPDAALIEAGRILLRRIEGLLVDKESFVLETTLSGRGYLRLVRRARSIGFDVRLTYIWIETADLSVERVARRVEQGGHNVPERDIRRRHSASIKNFFQLYLPLANH